MICVATLTIALTTFGQAEEYRKDSLAFSNWEISVMINTIEEILEWQQQDMENGETNMGDHSEGWGSNYWLTEMVTDLNAKLHE